MMLLVPSTAPAAQRVAVVVETDAGSSVLALKEIAREAAFVRAVMQEADAVLHHPLSPERRGLLEEYLRPEVRQLVLSYSDLGFEEQGDGWMLTAEVDVNTSELKERLKNLGVFYTAGTEWPYTLSTRGFGVEDLEKVLVLQQLTGLNPMADAELRLELERAGEKYWRALLNSETVQWAGEGRSLEDAWIKVWSQFFSQAEVQSAVSDVFVLRIEGWTTTEAVEAFDDMLGGWKDSVDQASIVMLTFNPDGLSAVWRVRTMDSEGFAERVASFTRLRGLVHDISAQGEKTKNETGDQSPLSLPL